MLVPARKIKAGAQKWVIHRVKKTPAVGPPAGTPENTRTWSIAITIITAPRIRSIDATRDLAAVATAGAETTPALMVFLQTRERFSLELPPGKTRNLFDA